MLRIGIVGAGNICVNAHIPAYKHLTDRVKIVAVADLSLERAEKAAALVGAKAYASVEELLANEEVDAIDICAWNGAHAPIAIAAARAGKHILCEKPMADSLENAKKMMEEVEKAGVTFMLAVVTRYSPEARFAHMLQENGSLGEIYYAKATYTRRRGTPKGWFTDKKKSGGGPVIDVGVHCIDRAWFLMGRPRPVSVSAMTSYRIGDFKTKGVDRWCAFDMGDGTFDTEDSASAYIRFENGAVLAVEASWAQNLPGDETGVVLEGSRAGVTFGPLTIYTEDENGYLTTNRPEIGADVPGGMFRYEIEHFLDCVEKGETPISSLDNAYTVQKILDGIYRSAAAGHEVTLD